MANCLADAALPALDPGLRRDDIGLDARLRGHDIAWGTPSSPSEGPSARWHGGIHRTDAHGARRYEDGRDLNGACRRGGRVGVFVAAASSPAEGPSVSWHAGIHPTGAHGARRYEEGCQKAAPRRGARQPLRSGGVIAGGGAVGKVARWHPPDRRAWRAPLRRESPTRRLAMKCSPWNADRVGQVAA